MKKYITAAFQIIIFTAVIYFCYVNISNTTNIALMPNTRFYEINTAFLIITLYLIGLFTGIIHSFVNKSLYRSQIEFYARKNEKLSQQNEMDTDDKEALERKVATLEIALQNALKNHPNKNL